jgi:hypothetical protein
MSVPAATAVVAVAELLAVVGSVSAMLTVAALLNEVATFGAVTETTMD